MTDKNVLPEAPASLNFKGITSKGWDVMFTLRDHDEVTLLERFGEFLVLLEETYRVTPNGKPAPTTATPVSHDTAPEQPPAGFDDMPASINERYEVEPEQVQAQPETKVFAAESLVANMHEGKTYWKIKGGKFNQYGVTIWPEVLVEAGLDPERLDANKAFSMKGRSATYIENEKGNPQKVTSLTKA